jgi:hypothetical protein
LIATTLGSSAAPDLRSPAERLEQMAQQDVVMANRPGMWPNPQPVRKARPVRRVLRYSTASTSALIRARFTDR